MPILHQKHKIIKKFILGKIDNHIAKEERLSREYIGYCRERFQNTRVKDLLDQCEKERIHYPHGDYIKYKFLIDAKLVRVISISIFKVTTLIITPLGKRWLSWLKDQSL